MKKYKKTREEKILAEHYRDMLGLAQIYLARGGVPMPQSIQSLAGARVGALAPRRRARAKPTKKQLKALAEGRKVLAKSRGKLLQI